MLVNNVRLPLCVYRPNNIRFVAVVVVILVDEVRYDIRCYHGHLRLEDESGDHVLILMTLIVFVIISIVLILLQQLQLLGLVMIIILPITGTRPKISKKFIQITSTPVFTASYFIDT